jgi:hypothetical protein
MDKQSREEIMKALNKGTKCQADKYAAGGAAKVRKGEATAGGKQIKKQR